MALNTRDRRASAISAGKPYCFVLPNPDAGAEGQPDRQHLARAYSGILALELGFFEIGETTILTSNDGNSSRISSNLAILPQAGTIQSMSLYVVTAVGNTRLAIYDDTGTGGGPGALKAETASTVAVGPNTWNVIPVITQVLLPAGNYWLALQNSSNGLLYKRETTGGSSALYQGFAYAAYPDPFVITGTGANRYSLSAQFIAEEEIEPEPEVSGPLPGSLMMAGYGR